MFKWLKRIKTLGKNNVVVLRLANGKEKRIHFGLPVFLKGNNNRIIITNSNGKLPKRFPESIEIRANDCEILLASDGVFDGSRIFINNNKTTIDCSKKITIKADMKFESSPGNPSTPQHFSIGGGTTIFGMLVRIREETCVEIGSNCLFSRDIEILSSDYHSIFSAENGELLNSNKGGIVKIGDRVWVGHHVYFFKKALVANDSVIGSVSTVMHKFHESGVLIAGIPAKIIKRGLFWSRTSPATANKGQS